MDSLSQSFDAPLKRCSSCSRKAGKDVFYPATAEYFHRDKQSKDKLCSSCKQCRTAHTAAYNKDHPDERSAYNKQYYADHIAESKERNALWISVPENLARKNQSSRDWYSRDLENNREHARLYFQTERGRIASRAHSHNRRAIQRKVGGKHTLAELLELFESQGGICFYCKAPLGTGRGSWHADHYIPLSKGGSNDISNIVISCPKCNRKKHDKLPHEWIR